MEKSLGEEIALFLGRARDQQGTVEIRLQMMIIKEMVTEKQTLLKFKVHEKDGN